MGVDWRTGVSLGALALLFICGCEQQSSPLLFWQSAAHAANPGSEEDAQADVAQHPDGPPNRLAHEISPYLRLHAHNPVDWYPWGPDAFEKARKEQKPIFLSIGYSSCYWCHVMERLVFSDPQIAEYMNAHFVNIKVDREERPEIDDIYMTALEVYFQLSGANEGGGWPLSMFLTPDGKPFAGGTYFPPNDEEGRFGFRTVLERVDHLWKTKRDDLKSNAEIITTEVRRLLQPSLVLERIELTPELASETLAAVADSYDPQHGGVGFDSEKPDGPKFPSPPKLRLLQFAAERGDANADKILKHTLERMAAGGIRDHLGGGFHRYSTDRAWHVPHFEKMLYDQAQLAELYVDQFRRSALAADRQVAEATFDFVLRELTDPQGGFYSALDAETDGVEGKYYVWSPLEIEQALGAEDAKLFGAAYGLDDPQVFDHGYVLHQTKSIDELAAARNTTADALSGRLAEMRAKLLDQRTRRKPLLRDDKILTGWNGLMIRALAAGGKALGRADYTAAAEKAARYVLTNMRDDQGRLYRRYGQGKAGLDACLDDYAFFVAGLLALHTHTGDAQWLKAAEQLMDDQIARFWDEERHGFYFTSREHEQLLARSKNAFDSALPSGNGVSVCNLLQLSAATGRTDYRDRAVKTLAAFAPTHRRTPGSLPTVAVALSQYLDGSDSPADEPRSSEPPPSQPIVLTAGEAPQNAKREPELVSAQVYLAHDKLPIGGACRIAVVLKIQDGWHINTNPPQPKFLKPTTVTLNSKQKTTLSDLKYPAGKSVAVEGFDEPLSVYEKSVTIYGVLKSDPAATAAADDLEIVVLYQACDEKHCLAPKTIKLAGRVPLARPGEPIKNINQKMFPPTAQR